MSVLKFDPVTGRESEPITPGAYRIKHGLVAWLFNPYTGKPRDPRDIGSDVQGHLIEPGEELVGAEDAPAACQGASCHASAENDYVHSAECLEETAILQGWADFGGAIRALKAGKRVARRGWNGKGMWLSLSGPSPYRTIPADAFWSKNNADYARSTIDGCANVLPCITMKTATGEILMGWLASQTDMLAEDWIALEG